MLKPVLINIDEIYIPADRRKEIDQAEIDIAAEEIMNEVEHPPLMVRKGKDRYVLTKGVNRLEARRALGDEKVEVLIVGAKLF